MFDDRGPIYRQIANQIKADVLSGTLKGDEQVLSTNQYAAFYRINPATAGRDSPGLKPEAEPTKCFQHWGQHASCSTLEGFCRLSLAFQRRVRRPA